MTAVFTFLIETILASVILVCVACAGVRMLLSQILSRDLELHKLKLQESVEQAVKRLPPEAPTTPATPIKLAEGATSLGGEVARDLFQLFDRATLSIIRFALEFRAEKLEAADQAGRAAIENTSDLSNFARLHSHLFSKELGQAIEAPASALLELAWRSYKVFKDPALSEKQTASQLESLNAQVLDAGEQIEIVKIQIVKVIANSASPPAA